MSATVVKYGEKITESVHSRKSGRFCQIRPEGPNFKKCPFLFAGVLTVAFIGLVGILVGVFVLLVHPYDVLFKWVGIS